MSEVAGFVKHSLRVAESVLALRRSATVELLEKRARGGDLGRVAVAEGGRSRPAAGRPAGGSLEGPVSPGSDNGVGAPVGAPGRVDAGLLTLDALR